MTAPRKEVHPRRRSGRRARLGHKPAHEIAALRQHPAVRRWIDVIEAMLPSTICAEGEILAREGMVMSIEFRAGVIAGVVQRSLPVAPTYPPTGTVKVAAPVSPPGVSAGPQPGELYTRQTPDCHVAIRVPVYDEGVWQQAQQSVAADGSAVAPLLAGELPGDLDDVLARHGAPLAPRANEQITMQCSGDSEALCAHVAALMYLAADRLHDDASLALIVRGSSSAELIERVRQERAAAARRSAVAPGAAARAEEQASSALEALPLDEFWRTGPELEDFVHLPPPNHAPHALLRRLGPSPLGGSFPLVGLLASAYDTIKAHAEKLRDEAERGGE